MILFIAIQTGGKERTTEEWGFSPPTLSQPIWMLSQRQVGLSVESESEHCSPFSCTLVLYLFRKHTSLYALQLFELNCIKLVSEKLIELHLFTHSGLCWKGSHSWRDKPGNQSWAWARLHRWGTTFPQCTYVHLQITKSPLNQTTNPNLLSSFCRGRWTERWPCCRMQILQIRLLTPQSCSSWRV